MFRIRPFHTWRLAQPIANAFRKSVSGSPDGAPPWVQLMAEDGEGFFEPDSAVWQVHGSLSTLVGGVRALLLQAAHPAPLAGVAEHSRYKQDPIDRLIGTTRWLTITSFAAEHVIMREAKRVNAMHSKVRGTYRDKSGHEQEYEAQNQRYLLWVHCAFTDSFLAAHLALKSPLTASPDDYVRDWSKSATPLGLQSAPQSYAELADVIEDFRRKDLVVTERTKEVVHFILNPPFGRGAMIFYRLLSNSAIATLDERDRILLGLPRRSRIWLHITALALRAFHLLLGPEPPSMVIARERIERAKLRRHTNGT